MCDLSWVTRKRRPRKISKSTPDIALVDLFSGCGGLSLGIWEACRLENLNLTIKLAIDTSEPALGVYRNFFQVDQHTAEMADVNKLLPGDIGDTLLPAEKALRSRLKKVDVLVAGPPCQGHSDLNNSSRRNDSRNRLYLKVARFAEIVRPATIIIENVPPVIHDQGNVVGQVREKLLELGYNVSDKILSLAEFGIAQNRNRHVLVGTLYPHPKNFLDHNFSNDHKLNLGQYISDLEFEYLESDDIFRTPSKSAPQSIVRMQYLFENNLFDLPDEMRPNCHKNKKHSYKSVYGRLKWNEPAQTLTTGFGSMGQGRFVHPSQRRVITPHEAARLQGFPDFFSFDVVERRTELQEMIGNAVPPQLSAWIFAGLLKHKSNNNLKIMS